MVAVNPEYGKRLGDEAELEGVYKALGDFFKQSCGGYRAGLFTGNLKLAKRVGLHAHRRVVLMNGPHRMPLAAVRAVRGEPQVAYGSR